MLFEGCETLGYFSLWRPQPRLSQPLQLVGPSATSPLLAKNQFMILGIEGALILTLTWNTTSCAFFSKNILIRGHWQLVERKKGPSATPWLSKTHHILISILIQLLFLNLNITHTQSITAWREWLDFRLVSSSFSDYRAGTSNESLASQISPARTVRWKTSRFQVDPDKHLISRYQ